MKNLWAPWRLQYILGRNANGCFLCRALKRRDDRQSLLLRRGRTCSIIMNRFPYSGGHLMVFPHRHIADLARLTPAEQGEMMRLIAEAVRALRQSLHPAGFNIGMNLGRCAGAGLEEHIHMHVVPRWSGDTNFMPVMTGLRIMPQLLTDLWDQLRPLFGRVHSPARSIHPRARKPKNKKA